MKIFSIKKYFYLYGGKLFKKFKEKGSQIKKSLKSKKKKKTLKKTSKHFTKVDLIKGFKEIGLERGDVVMVHSSLSSIRFVKGGPKTVVEALLEVIGEEGTLVMPTNPMRGGVLKHCKSGDFVFDHKKSKAYTGAIPNALLKFKGIHRSIHPSHSVAAFGKFSKFVTETHHIGNRTCGKNSPWAKIIELNGKVFGLGITIAWTTQYHYLEDIMEDAFPVKVKVDETYKLKCKLENGDIIEVEVQPNDPKISKTRIEKNPFIRKYMEEIFDYLKILHHGEIGNAESWWFNLRDFIIYLRKLAEIGITIYSTEDYLKSNNLYPLELIEEYLK